jgi:hypothetical protein
MRELFAQRYGGHHHRQNRGLERLRRLPQQYFMGLACVLSQQPTCESGPLVDLGRKNPETGPPQDSIDALADATDRHRPTGSLDEDEDEE